MTYGERPVERRLREALDARAAGVTVRELRPADPPGPHVRRFPGFPVARLRSLGLPLAGLAAAAAAMVGYLVLAPEPPPVRPAPPAAPPEIGSPTPTPRPSPSVMPDPSSAPTPGPSTTPSATRTPTGASVSPSKSVPSSASPPPTSSRSTPPSASPSPFKP